MTRVDNRLDPYADPWSPYPPEPEFHLRDYWFIVLKRRWLVTAVTICALLLAGIHALRQKPLYRSTAVLQIDRGRLNLVQDVMVKDAWAGYVEFYPTQERVMRSRTLATRVVDNLQLWEHPLFRAAGESEPSPERRRAIASSVQGMLRVGQVQNTQLMEVSYITPDPELSADLANALVRQYIAFGSETVSGVARDTSSFISEQIEKLQREIQQKEKLLQDYSRREDIVLVGKKESIVVRQLEDLNQQLATAKVERLTAEARYQSLRRADPASLEKAHNDPTIRNLQNERASLQKQQAELSAKFKPDWPELKRAREALEDVERRLTDELGVVARDVVSAAKVEYESAVERERLLQRALDQQKRDVLDLNKATADYDRISVELDNQRAMLQQLLRRHSETGLSAEIGERQPVNVRVVEQALPPGAPTGPRLSRMLATGGVIGLLLGLALAFFLNYWDNSIHTIEDLRRYVSLPYLGMVPRFPRRSPVLLAAGRNLKLLPASSSHLPSERSGGKDLGITRSALAVSRRSGRSTQSGGEETMISERFKFIRGSLMLSSPGTSPRTVLITGPDKNAGKTFVACNLASSLAELGKKVLLIDADLRNPQVHRIFRFRNRVGLSSFLTDQAKMQEGGIYSTPYANVFVMLSGPPSPSPAELLNSAQMEKLLAQCTASFDFVLLDSAPLLPVFDSHVLTTRCDACVLVVRSRQDTRQAVRTSVDLVERVGGKITGVILNDVDLNDYAQSYYHNYYSYEYGSYPRENAS